MIHKNMESLRRAIKSFDLAILKNREGAAWQDQKDGAENDLRLAELALPAIGDGPHVMSIDQWIQICNRFCTVRDADELLEEIGRRKARAAAHTPPATGTAPS